MTDSKTAALVEALTRLLAGNQWRQLQGEWGWHVRKMPDHEDLTFAREALAALQQEPDSGDTMDAARYRALRLTLTASNERRPFWGWYLTDTIGQQALTPEGLDREADELRAKIAKAAPTASKTQAPGQGGG